jgi:hypothetical protein
MELKKTYNYIPKFFCEPCYFKCCIKSDMDRHMKTRKHKVSVGGINLELNYINLHSSQKNFVCCCGKIYNTQSGLWKHKQKCNTTICQEENVVIKENDVLDKELILNLLKQNTELLEIIKNGTSNNSNNIINSNNKTFNLQVFLNETCKDAMNISDFVDSVKLQVSDLENVGKVGYIEGISNIIIKNLQALEVEKRPVHCTDQKREVMYVKEDNIWEKEDEANKKLRKAIRTIAHKNICMLKAFREKYPDCQEYDSKKGSQYNKLVIEAMGGKGDNDYEKDTKIIKKIAKAVGIEKN